MLMLTVIWLTFIFSFILSRLTIMNIYCYITREKITTEGKQKITMVKVWSKLTLATFLKSSNMWQEGRLGSLALILQKACNQLTNSYSVLACSYFLTCKKISLQKITCKSMVTVYNIKKKKNRFKNLTNTQLDM